MSNNAPDYENDLVFPPSMPRCDIEELKEKLKIAIEALEFYGNKENNCFGSTNWDDWGEQYASVNGDIENGYKARQTLAKIKE